MTNRGSPRMKGVSAGLTVCPVDLRRSRESLAHVALRCFRSTHHRLGVGRGWSSGPDSGSRMRSDLRNDGLERDPRRPQAQPARLSFG